MKQSAYQSLSPRQAHVLMLAMYIRNVLEDFHVANLSDAQMKDLNQIMRQALYDVISLIEEDGPDRDRALSYLIGMIPDYWEIPDDTSRIV